MKNTGNEIKKNEGYQRLPDTEFEVMQAIWGCTPPVTTTMLMEQIGVQKSWKLQTLTTLLNRLIDRGFLKTEKLGKERTYYPLVKEEDYIEYETMYFVKRYHKNSLTSLVNAFYANSKLNPTEIQELNAWLQSKEEEN